MASSDKTREITLRRAAERQALRVQRSRRRDPRAQGYGTYRLVDEAGRVVLGDERFYGKTLDDLERYLKGENHG